MFAGRREEEEEEVVAVTSGGAETFSEGKRHNLESYGIKAKITKSKSFALEGIKIISSFKTNIKKYLLIIIIIVYCELALSFCCRSQGCLQVLLSVEPSHQP